MEEKLNKQQWKELEDSLYVQICHMLKPYRIIGILPERDVMRDEGPNIVSEIWKVINKHWRKLK